MVDIAAASIAARGIGVRTVQRRGPLILGMTRRAWVVKFWGECQGIFDNGAGWAGRAHSKSIAGKRQ